MLENDKIDNVEIKVICVLKTVIQDGLSLSPFGDLYDILIDKDNFWRMLNETVDLSFIYNEVQKNYCANMGRPAQDPILMFKYVLLKSAMKLSDRDLIRKTRVDMEMKYFLGYAPEETNFIDPSLLSKFRHIRLKDLDLVDLLLNKTVEIALSTGVMNVRNKLIQDSTHTHALYQQVSPREELLKRAKDLRKAVYAVDEGMKEKMPSKRKANSGLLEDTIEYTKEVIKAVETEGGFENCVAVNERMDYLREGIEDTETEIEYSKDRDARIGHKTADTNFFGYKTHIAMSEERIITAAVITSGEKHDGKQMQELVEKSEAAGIEVEAVIGDGAYSEKENIEYCKEKEIKLASKLSRTVLHGNRRNSKRFEYNKDAGMYVCPQGHMAYKKVKTGTTKDKNGVDTRVELYFFNVEKCKYCPKRKGCYKEGAKTKTYSVKVKSDIHIEYMDYMKTKEFEELYAHRYKIEAKNGELKSEYGYDTAQGCGLLSMNIQGAGTMFMVNMKRIFKLMKYKGV